MSVIHVCGCDIFSLHRQAVILPVDAKGAVYADYEVSLNDRYPHEYQRYKEMCAAGELKRGDKVFFHTADMLEAGSVDGDNNVIFHTDDCLLIFVVIQESFLKLIRPRSIKQFLKAAMQECIVRDIKTAALPWLGLELQGNARRNLMDIYNKYLGASLPTRVTVHAS